MTVKKPKLVAVGAVLVVAVAVGEWAVVAAGDEPEAGRPSAGASTSPTGAAPAPTDPAGVLVAAAAKVDEQAYRLTVGSGATAEGDTTVLTWDPKARRGTETTSLKVRNGEVRIERLTTGADVYVRVSAPDRRVDR